MEKSSFYNSVIFFKLDFWKAYDKVDSQFIFWCMCEFGILKDLVFIKKNFF
jgi:hypothetical protein